MKCIVINLTKYLGSTRGKLKNSNKKHYTNTRTETQKTEGGGGGRGIK